MAILLTILKVIGIILLVLLGIILLFIFLVLFTPISYRFSAVHNENETRANVKIGFLIVNAIAGYERGKGLDYCIKALFFKIFPRGGNEEEDLPDEYDALEEYLNEQDSIESAHINENVNGLNANNIENSQDNILDNPDFASEQITESANTIQESDKESLNNVQEADNESVGVSSEPELVSQEIKEKTDIKTKISSSIEKAIDKTQDEFYELADKADKKLDEADKNYNKAMTKLDHILQFLDRDYVQRTINRFLKVLKRLFGTVKPKKSKGYVHLGLNSSADTGMLLGKIAPFYPLYGRWLTVDPDFYNKVLEGDIDVKGRIYLFRFVFPVLGIALTRDFWRTYKLSKKI